MYPGLHYGEACQTAGPPTLHHHWDDLCKRRFEDCQTLEHRLHSLLPPERNVLYGHCSTLK